MRKLHFPAPFQHRHRPVRNVNELLEERITLGQRAADWVANVMGSWPFILGQSALLLAWAAFNTTAWVYHWDPYPFILMNLMLSLQAAYTAPMIMMSQQRQVERDRLNAHNDYLVNQKAEEEVRAVLEHLAAQDDALRLVHGELAALRGNVVQSVPGPAAASDPSCE
jgi:uncharacterized membrane protein